MSNRSFRVKSGVLGLAPQSSPPSNANTGDLYVSLSNTLNIWNGSSWQEIGGGLSNENKDNTDDGGSLTANTKNFIDTSTAAFELNLPAGSANSTIIVLDTAGFFSTNNFTVTPAAGEQIADLAVDESLIFDVSGSWAEFTWDSVNSKWALVSPLLTAVGGAPHYNFTGLASQLETALPITHGLGDLPQSMEMWVEQNPGEWEQHDPATYILATSTQLISTSVDITTSLSGDPEVRLIASRATPASALDVASATQSGIVSTGVQTFAGAKTFNDAVTLSGGVSGNVAFDTDTLFVDASSNNVGIGTPSPGADYKLHVSSPVTSTIQRIESTIAGGSVTGVSLYGANATNEFVLAHRTVDDTFYISHNPAAYDGASINAASVFAVTSSGNVSIGTPAADRTLVISDDPAVFWMIDSAGSTNDKIVQLQCDGGQFEINARNDNGTVRTDNILVADLGTGNVSIGTNDSTEKLTILGSATSLASGSSSGGIDVLGGSSGNGNYTAGIGFGLNLSQGGRAGIAGWQDGGDADQMGLRFYTHSSGTGADPSELTGQISSNGAWTLGASSGTDSSHTIQSTRTANGGTLVVDNGNTNVNSTDKAVIFVDFSGDSTPTAGHYIRFQNAGDGDAGSVAVNGTNNVTFNTSSDSRWKLNQRPSEYGLAQVLAVEPKFFEWKSDNKSDFGLVAQEVYAEMPLAVNPPTDPENKWQMDYGKLSAILWKAVQEQHALFEDLQAKLSAAEAEIAILKGAAS